MPRTGQHVAGHVLQVAVSSDDLTETWRALHVSTNAQRAVRVLRPEAARYRRELHDLLVAQRRADHPNRLDLFEITDVDGQLAVVTEWVQGPSLRTWTRVRPRELDELLQMFAEIADAVGAVHRAGLVQGALDLRRIWMRPSHSQAGFFPKVDLAVGPIASDLPLSPLRAPEQITGDRVDAGTDVYLLGAVLFEMLTRELPHVGSDFERSRPDAPPGLVRLIEATLRPDPRKRPRSVDHVRDDVMVLLLGPDAPRTAPPDEPAAPEDADGPAWPRYQLALAAGAALAGSLGTAFWLATH
jgi:serine/threonine-protein kinase